MIIIIIKHLKDYQISTLNDLIWRKQECSQIVNIEEGFNKSVALWEE